jgi:Uma2 family endonuclease
MTAAPPLHYGYAEYVAFEASADVKHEYVRGLILAMAGGTPEHGARAVRVMAALSAALRDRSCVVYDPDVRVRIAEADVTAYPDASVVCGQLETDQGDPHAITNPLVVVEVLSPSTEEYDRGDKFEAYKQIASLREVVFVAHDAARIDVWRRDDAGWALRSSGPEQRARLESVDCELAVDEIFRDPFASR